MGCPKLKYCTKELSSFTVWKNNEKLKTPEKNSRELKGQYAEKDTTTGWNAFQLRMYDPLIGRWLSTDPYRQYASPYNGMGNDPINGVDPDGGYKHKWMAKIHAFFNGGTVDYAQDRGEWFVGKDVANTFSNGEVQVNFQRQFNPGFDVQAHGNVTGTVNFGLLGYSDAGVAGSKIDIISAELAQYKAQATYSLFSGTIDYSGKLTTLADRDYLKVKSGVSAEIPVTPRGPIFDVKVKQVTHVTDIGGGKVHAEVHNIEYGGGAPFFETKAVHGNDAHFRIGSQEDVGGSLGPIGGTMSYFLGIKIIAK